MPSHTFVQKWVAIGPTSRTNRRLSRAIHRKNRQTSRRNHRTSHDGDDGETYPASARRRESPSFHRRSRHSHPTSPRFQRNHRRRHRVWPGERFATLLPMSHRRTIHRRTRHTHPSIPPPRWGLRETGSGSRCCGRFRSKPIDSDTLQYPSREKNNRESPCTRHTDDVPPDRRLKTVVCYLPADQPAKPTDRLLLRCLAVLPELPKLIPPLRIGDVLVVTPQRIEPPAQLVDQVMIVVTTAGRLADVFQLMLGNKRHSHGLQKGLGLETGPSSRGHDVCRIDAIPAGTIRPEGLLRHSSVQRLPRQRRDTWDQSAPSPRSERGPTGQTAFPRHAGSVGMRRPRSEPVNEGQASPSFPGTHRLLRSRHAGGTASVSTMTSSPVTVLMS
jgi:hypothetical protein